jgi:hypothetical protein
MRKIPFYMAYYLSGGILILVGGILLHFGTISRGTPWLLGSSVLVSIGCGICAQTVRPQQRLWQMGVLLMITTNSHRLSPSPNRSLAGAILLLPLGSLLQHK